MGGTKKKARKKIRRDALLSGHEQLPEVLKVSQEAWRRVAGRSKTMDFDDLPDFVARFCAGVDEALGEDLPSGVVEDGSGSASMSSLGSSDSMDAMMGLLGIGFVPPGLMPPSDCTPLVPGCGWVGGRGCGC